jgi:hypothetical protein
MSDLCASIAATTARIHGLLLCADYDYVEVGGVQFSGGASDCPTAIQLHTSTAISWTSDETQEGQGWQICTPPCTGAAGGASSNGGGQALGTLSLAATAPVAVVADATKPAVVRARNRRLQNNLATELGIDVADVSVSFNPSDGSTEFAVRADSGTEATTLQQRVAGLPQVCEQFGWHGMQPVLCSDGSCNCAGVC